MHAGPNGVVLRAADLGKRYVADGPAALRDVSFEVSRGEFLAVVGPSGSGKTTLIRLLSGLSAPSDGAVFFEGRRFDRPPREVAVVFQDYSRSLFPWLSVKGNVTFALRALPRSVRASRAEAVLAQVGLEDVGRKHPWELSGGMQQRVAIARALVSRPEVIFLDEPFASVDALTRSELQDLLMRVHAEGEYRSVTIVHVTHDIEEAVYLADRVLVLSPPPGRVVREIDVELPRPRMQTETRSLPRYLEVRNEIHALIGSQRPLLENGAPT